MAGRGLILLAVLFACRSEDPVSRTRSRVLMGSYVTITASGADAAVEKAFARLQDINRRFNFRDSTGPLYGFNLRDEPFADAEIAGVIRTALEVGAATGGAFDITVQPLVELWGFYTGGSDPPDPAALDSTLALVGMDKVAVSGDSVLKPVPGLRLDLGGIAKGHALAEAARVLRTAGIHSALVDAGGDIYALGRRQDGREWRIGVRHPRGEGIVAVIPVADRAVVTSGDYERAFTAEDGTVYCHIIDPRLGRPARALASVTVVAADPVRADAWATGLFVLGPDEGLALVEATDDIEALFVTPELEMRQSSGLAGILAREEIP